MERKVVSLHILKVLEIKTHVFVEITGQLFTMCAKRNPDAQVHDGLALFAGAGHKLW